jgi:hypothetical protein
MEFESKKCKVIKFGSACSIQNLEKSIRDFQQNNGECKNILFDFSDVTFIEVPSLIFLIAFIDNKQSENAEMWIELPNDINVRNFIRIFRLPTILSYITGKKFKDLVTTEGLRYFGENSMLRGDTRISRDKTYSNLFPFKTNDEKSYALESLLVDWNGALMQAYLKKFLNSSEDDKERLVPNRIFFESITNSQRHSNADKLMVSAIAKRESEEGGNFKNVFHISFWDNGNNIIETLKKTINAGEPIRNNEIFSDGKTKTIQASYYIKYENSKFNNTIFNSDIDLTNIINDDGLVLLSSFFPGVSEDPKGLNQWNENPYLDERDAPLKYPGMGLTVLLNAAIDLLDGQVSVRVEKYFLNIKKPKQKALSKYREIDNKKKYEKFYEVRIKEINENAPFKGNMLTIRLPLKEK